MEQELQLNRINFIETLNQEYLSAKGYGAGAYLSTASIITLYNQFSNQYLPEQEFIKSFIKRPLLVN